MVGRMLQPHDNYRCAKCHSWKSAGSGWKSAGITDVFQVVVKGLGSLDPFQDIDPLIEQEADENSAIFNATRADITVLKSKYSVDTQQD